VFGLANAPVSTSTCTMGDAYRLKRNFGYWLLSYCKQDFDTFSEDSKAVIEHHFNNHAHCNGWRSMKNSDSMTVVTGNLMYPCKKNNPKFYKQICDVMTRFTLYKKLKECHHHYITVQKNGSVNRHISQFYRKRYDIFSIDIVGIKSVSCSRH
jgi:hypothetical protein